MERVIVIGGGLVGSLLAIVLARCGYAVRVFEKHPDPRTAPPRAGRSINLTLCHRGFQALDQAGCGDTVRAAAIPAYGRVIHDAAGAVSYQPYGVRGEALFSIQRSDLNRVLLDFAETRHGVEMRFRHRCIDVDFPTSRATFECLGTGATRRETAAAIVGADGAFSAVRAVMQRTDRFDFSQQYFRLGYKELSVPAEAVARWGMERNALHIWPRGGYMLIGFPNADGSATLSLHMPLEGKPSFASIGSEAELVSLFSASFPDTLDRIPLLAADYFNRPVSSMLTIRCFPWVRGRVALIGDAAHAIVPSYGQGANAGFEDCAVLAACLERSGGDWQAALADYQRLRKPDTDVIADLALLHFDEICAHVGDPGFLLRKTLERRLDELYPGRFLSLYSLISFTSLSYQETVAVARRNEALLDRILAAENVRERLERNTVDGLLHEYVASGAGDAPPPAAANQTSTFQTAG